MIITNIKNTIRRAILTSIPLLYGGVIGMGLLSSCSDFLQEEDKDKMIPETVEQFQAMLHKEAFLNVSWFYRSDIMTDCISENSEASTDNKSDYWSLYTWQRDVEIDGSGHRTAATNSMWGNLYNDILVANYIIEQASDATGTESARNQIIGEAYFVRGRAYLELISIYAEPYDAATADATQGVPLRYGTGVTNDYARSSVAAVYSQIESDLTTAKEYLSKSRENKSLWHPNAEVAQLLLSRVYLYKGEWQRVVDATDDLVRGTLYDMTLQPNSPVITTSNPEVLHCYGSPANLINEGNASFTNNVPSIYGSAGLVTYCVSDKLLNAFHKGDCRPYTFFISEGGVDVPAKWHSQYTRLGAYSYRLSEAYLSRAEALERLGRTQEAESLMRKFLASRVVNSAVNVPLPSSGGSSASSDTTSPLLRFILDERWLEFCCENMRWYDLRRAPEDYLPELKHTFTRRSAGTAGAVGAVNGVDSYSIKAGSPNFTFDIPLSEAEINSTITRYDKRTNPSQASQ